jgi:hypothetical protein
MCNDVETQISLNPADYTLYHLGSFDNTTCKISQKDPVSLGNGVQFIKIQTEETADT